MCGIFATHNVDDGVVDSRFASGTNCFVQVPAFVFCAATVDVLVHTATERHVDCALGFCGNTNVVLKSNLDHVHYVASISTFLSHHVCIIAFWAFSVNRIACCKNTTKVLPFLGVKSTTFCYFSSGSLVLLSIDMTDLYHQIYQGEIFQKSQCIWHENTLMNFFRSNLLSLGYEPLNDNNKVYQRGTRQVVICLVDDFSTCSTNHNTSLPYLFDKDTVVITDNYITVPTQYQVCQLPPSFFGIYNHTPSDAKWNPDRRFNFSVNRLDTKRMLVLLEIWNRVMLMALNGFKVDNLDYINFNCWSWSGDNGSVNGLKENFTQQWQQLELQYQEVYQHVYDDLLPHMPFCNHDLEHKQSHLQAWANIVIETYSSDTTVALSEKMFRALCLPVPWIVYSGKHTVAYLHSLGFDVLHDLISHDYDSIIENKTADPGDKMVVFIFEGHDAVEKIKATSWPELSQRCEQAAQHNQNLLAQMQSNWPTDFANWWPSVIEKIK